MALLDVVFRMLDKAGTAFVEPRAEDGHGSAAVSPSFVRDDYTTGELLNDQVGASAVLTFTFSAPVVSFWVAVQGTTGTCKIDHYGGTPSATRGIPVEAGGMLPIPEPATTVRVYAPTSLRVTVWGQRRA